MLYPAELRARAPGSLTWCRWASHPDGHPDGSRLLDLAFVSSTRLDFSNYWKSAVLVLNHLVLGWIGFEFYLGGNFVPLGWPAIGVGVVLVAWWGLRYWPALLVGSAIYQVFIHGMSGFSAVCFIVGDVGEILLGALLLARGIDWSMGFCTIRQTKRGILVGLTAPLVGAFFGTLGSFVEPEMPRVSAEAFVIFPELWLRSAMGFLFVAPAVGAWRLKPKQPLGRNRVEGSMVILFVASICVVAFTEWLPLGVPPVWIGMLAGLPLIWSGARLGIWLTTHLSVLVLASASFASLFQVSIFGNLGDGDLRFLWWSLLNVCAFGGTILAVLTHRAHHQARGIAAARERLHLLVRNSPMALVEWDLDFRVRHWSRKAEEIFGFTQEQAVGAHGLDLMVPDEEREIVMEQWTKVLEGQEGARGTNHNLDADGRRMLCDWFGSSVHDEKGEIVGVVCLVEDVTERERSAVALRQSQQHFEAVTRVIPQSISYYSPKLEVLYGNRAYLESRNLEAGDFPIPLEHLMDDAIRTKSQPYIAQVLSGETVRFLESIQLGDGAVHDLDRVLLPDFGENGDIHGFFSVCTDITPYREAARERLALETQILQTQKLESLGMLSGQIAHEFNNRLCGILGHTDMARADIMEAPEQATASMEKAMEIAREASDLCRQLFVYSGHGSGVKTMQCVNPLIEEMRRLLELTLPKSVRLKTLLADDLNMTYLDAAQLRQAIVNLVQNAAQAIGHRRGEIRLESRKARLGDCRIHESFWRVEDPDSEVVEISVSDDGGGMDAATMSRIFEPFFTCRPGLRGLGLSGVLGIMHGHSGAVGLTSEPGIGTTVRLWLVAETAERSLGKEVGQSGRQRV